MNNSCEITYEEGVIKNIIEPIREGQLGKIVLESGAELSFVVTPKIISRYISRLCADDTIYYSADSEGKIKKLLLRVGDF